MCSNLTPDDTYLILGELDLSKLKMGVNPQNEERVLYKADSETIVIDRVIHSELSDYIRKCHNWVKEYESVSNDETKEYIIAKERRRLQRLARKPKDTTSQLMPLINAMIVQPGFDYNHASVWGISLKIFNDSLRAKQQYLNYENVNRGIYSGSLDSKKLDMSKINWLA
jgi:hypothetical protein